MLESLSLDHSWLNEITKTPLSNHLIIDGNNNCTVLSDQ